MKHQSSDRHPVLSLQGMSGVSSGGGFSPGQNQVTSQDQEKVGGGGGGGGVFLSDELKPKQLLRTEPPGHIPVVSPSESRCDCEEDEQVEGETLDRLLALNNSCDVWDEAEEPDGASLVL